MSAWINELNVWMCSLLWETYNIRGDQWIGLIISVIYKCFMKITFFPFATKSLEENSVPACYTMSYLILPILCTRSGFVLSSFLLKLLLFCTNPSLSLHCIPITFTFWTYFDIFVFLIFKSFFRASFTGVIWWLFLFWSLCPFKNLVPWGKGWFDLW